MEMAAAILTMMQGIPLPAPCRPVFYMRSVHGCPGRRFRDYGREKCAGDSMSEYPAGDPQRPGIFFIRTLSFRISSINSACSRLPD